MRNEAIQQTDGTWAVYINGGCKAHHLTLSQVSEQFEGLKFTILSARELGVGEQRNNYGTPSIMQSIFRPASRREAAWKTFEGWSPRRWPKNGLDKTAARGVAYVY